MRLTLRRLMTLALLTLALGSCRSAAVRELTLDYDTPVDPALQRAVERLDAELREQYGMTSEQAAVGVLDLRRGRVAMLHPDRIEYAASVPKVAILLAYFRVPPGAATRTKLSCGYWMRQPSSKS